VPPPTTGPGACPRRPARSPRPSPPESGPDRTARRRPRSAERPGVSPARPEASPRTVGRAPSGPRPRSSARRLATWRFLPASDDVGSA
jgi:hypothetical protein